MALLKEINKEKLLNILTQIIEVQRGRRGVTDNITENKLMMALKKSAGLDRISVECLKKGEDVMIKCLRRLFKCIL